MTQLGSSGIAGLAALDDDTGRAVRYSLARMNPFYVEGPASLYEPTMLEADWTCTRATQPPPA